MWYRRAQYSEGIEPSEYINKGINGPNDEHQHPDDSPEFFNDPYAVGKTRAIDATDEDLKNPKVDAYNMTLEEKLSRLHQEPMNRTESMSQFNSDAYTVYKGNNSATVAKSYENQPAMVPQNRPSTQYSR